MFLRKKKAPAPPVLLDITPKVEAVEPLNDGRSRAKVMVVDDDPVALKALSLALKSYGYKVVTASDGAQAIGVMRDEEPDVMLVDVNFPTDFGASMDGFQTTQWLRNINRKVPAIVMSGLEKPDYREKAAAAGARAFMLKSTSREQLLRAVERALNR